MPNAAPQPLFDKALLRRRRARWAGHFARHSALFEEVAASLAERLSFIKRDFTTVLEMNGRSDTLAEALLKADPARTVIRNVTPHSRESVNPAQSHDSGDIKNLDPRFRGDEGNLYACVFDEEFLPFAGNSFDLIVSSLHLHWANDVPGALIQARRALKPDGFFLAALLGGETLSELRACLYEAETELRGGLSPRVSPFMDLRDGAALLQRAGFTLPVADRERYTFTYPDIFALMNELRFMGEAQASFQKDRRFAPRALFTRAGEIYRQRFPAEDGIRATFEVLMLSGWAAHESQQKPLQPGAARHSLAQALRTEEIKTSDSATPLSLRRGQGPG